MNSDQLQGNWKQLKGKLKEKWGHLTDDDLDKIAGRREQLEGKLQERYGITKDAARKNNFARAELCFRATIRKQETVKE